MKSFWISLLLASAAVAADKPNVVLLYADDLGYGDVSCYGSKTISTPNIDKLAAEGLRFTDGHCAAATCTPSRFAVLTGQYPFRQKGTGVLPGDAEMIIKPGSTTLPAVFKKAGYATGAVGKWHLGLGSGNVDWNGEIKPSPNDVGFDESFIMAATGDRVPTVYIRNHRVENLDPAEPIEVNYKKPFPGLPDGKKDRATLKMDWSVGHNMAVINGIGRIGYMKGGTKALWKDDQMSQDFTREALGFIERHKDQPFFLYLAQYAVHDPIQGRGDLVVKYEKKLAKLQKSSHPAFVLEGNPDPADVSAAGAYPVNGGVDPLQQCRSIGQAINDAGLIIHDQQCGVRGIEIQRSSTFRNCAGQRPVEHIDEQKCRAGDDEEQCEVMHTAGVGAATVKTALRRGGSAPPRLGRQALQGAPPQRRPERRAQLAGRDRADATAVAGAVLDASRQGRVRRITPLFFL